MIPAVLHPITSARMLSSEFQTPRDELQPVKERQKTSTLHGLCFARIKFQLHHYLGSGAVESRRPHAKCSGRRNTISSSIRKPVNCVCTRKCCGSTEVPNPGLRVGAFSSCGYHSPMHQRSLTNHPPQA